MTVEHDGIPLWEVEIEGLVPVKATAIIAAPTAADAENAARRSDIADFAPHFEEHAYTTEVLGAKPAEAYWTPDLIVRKGDA